MLFMNIKAPIIMELIFIVISVLIYVTTSNTFFIFNFLYIGTAISIGLFLMAKNHRYARNLVMLAVGSYLFVYVGLLGHENLSLSGFWYYLGLGVFEGAVIWTAMILDLLPYKTPQNERKNWGYVRYILFAAISCGVCSLFVFKVANLDSIIFYLFILGNIIYYILGIVLAFYLKDNRAFCKYVCPITVFLKISSYFSLLRVEVNEDKCINCGKCVRACPMDVEMLNNSRKRENGTECILCLDCVHSCPNDALKL